MVKLTLHASCGCGFNVLREGSRIDDVVDVLEEAIAHADGKKHRLDIRGSVSWR